MVIDNISFVALAAFLRALNEDYSCEEGRS
jgi:hypothetical protein